MIFNSATYFFSINEFGLYYLQLIQSRQVDSNNCATYLVNLIMVYLHALEN